MTRNERARFDNHDEVWELLPWYVNGSLDAEEQGAIERHAKVCITCRAEIKAQRRFSAEVNLVDVEVLATRSAYRELDARINAADAAQVSPQRLGRRLVQAARGWIEDLHLPSRRLAAPALMVAVTLVVAVVFGLGPRIDATTSVVGEYRTLTTNDQRAASGKRDVRVVFSDRLTLEDVKETLEPLNASIVEGPSPQGVFLVRIGDPEIGFGELVTAVSSLRADRNVIFAEPAFPMPAPDGTQSK